ncbi:A-kinase anchor protein 13 isoform X2 [Folsomia candida]|nr:A-kinase anchor protein 13 isoform X2 [Folsomia candida]XP_021964283.1 A-kinase anchor protein 13 isoform X2 [Folsomia candida]XP_021964290.1 A-kinase anchor protein 13 isoform X2 [Folsomia candida]
MLAGQQRLESSLKSQTLPRLDGQDEEGDVLESQFELLSIANSCPDLTLLEIDPLLQHEIPNNNNSSHPSSGIDVVDGIKSVVPGGVGTTGSFRRSTSLSSLGVECVDGNHHEKCNGCPSKCPLVQSCCVAGRAGVGRASQVIGHLEKTLKKEAVTSGLISNDFIRTALRASHGGSSGSGYLHKSISTPSVTQYFISTVGGVGPQHELYQKSQHRVQSDAHQHSSKRSFFRRKHKSKSNLVPSGPRFANKMDGVGMITTSSSLSSINGSNPSQSLAFAALFDPSLGLQDSDAECWALSMSPEVVSRLEDKEVKRQEHMYELILTEKHHCLTLALMQHLFVGDMKKYGFARDARLLFPELNKLLEVHFSFLRRMRERQLKFRELGQPMDSLTDILIDQFTTEQYHLMIRLYGLLCASHTKSLDIFKSLIKDTKFASLVASWDKESLLGRKNVRECLLLVAQRITKYPLLIEPILKTSLNATPQERDQIQKALGFSRDLISKVDQRVAQRQRLLEVCNRIDPKSFTMVGQRRRGRDDIVSLPSRRLLFQGQAIVNCNRNSNPGGGAPANRNIPCTVFILTDSLIFTQEISLKFHFVSPPGIVMLNNLIVRENAGQTSSLFLVLGTGTSKPEMIDLQIIHPPNREKWLEEIRSAISKCVEETETGSDGDEEIDSTDLSDVKTTKALEELQEQDRQLLTSLRSRARLIESLHVEKPYHWVPSNFEGKDDLLNSLSSTCSEVQRVMNIWEANANSSVNRSASCVGEHGMHGALLGLPKRADTFGGFDSQQRSAFDLAQCTNNKLLMEMVIHLSQLCGEMFSQMIPQLMPSVYQTHHQLQRRMEDLREAQQRLETEKALFHQDLASQKEALDREKAELTHLKQTLQKEQEDITQQREQLYRKLEAQQKQMRLPHEPISPLTGTSSSSSTSSGDKVNTNPPQIIRRPLPTAPNSSSSASSKPSNNNLPAQNGVKKQQLPLFLASNSSFKVGKSSSCSDNVPQRNASVGSFRGGSVVSPPTSGSATNQSSPLDPSRLPGKAASSSSRNSSQSQQQQQQVQQLLPLRLSEGSGGGGNNKTSSLPRGVGSRSVSSMLNQMDANQQQQQQQGSNANQHHLRSSASTTTFSYNNHPGGDSNLNQRVGMQSNSSFLYGPVSQSGVRYAYTDGGGGGGSAPNNTSPPRNGHINENNDGLSSVIHRRAGSSPVPMSSVQQQFPQQQQARRPPGQETQYHQHQHPFFRQREDDGEKILFL